jgi:hypothetical protein
MSRYTVQMQAICAVELRSTVMVLWCDTPAGRKALERDGGYMRAEALVLNSQSLPAVPHHTSPFTLSTNNKMGGENEKPVFFFDIDNCVSTVRQH